MTTTSKNTAKKVNSTAIHTAISVKNAEKSEAQNFYNRLLRVYDAALKFMLRVAEKARECGKDEMANGLEGLTVSAPKTLFEAMQTSIVYYVLQTCFDGTYLRTLGRLDSLFYPYYLNEDKENAEMLTCDYISEIDRLGAAANIPFAIGGTNEDGKCLVNEMSYLLLFDNSKKLLACEKIGEGFSTEHNVSIRKATNLLKTCQNVPNINKNPRVILILQHKNKKQHIRILRCAQTQGG